MIEELQALLEQESYEVQVNGNQLHVENLDVYEITESSVMVDGYSSFVELPRRFVYDDLNTALPIIYPFILQALDGEPRI